MMNFAQKSVFEPRELSALKQTFDDVVHQTWFRKEARDDFARYVFKKCPDDGFDPSKYGAVLKLAARRFFARDTKRLR